MKRNGLFAVLLVAVLVLLSGCVTNLKDAYKGTSWNIGVPAAKDVKIMGLVRVEGLTTHGNGEKITYDALLKAAEAKGGDGIVNIMIDVKREGVQLFLWYINTAETWYGSALAVKYTDDNLTTRITETEGKTVKESIERSSNEESLSSAPQNPVPVTGLILSTN